ncbi:MAG: thiamine diphosphokinase [Synergistales bacterium]|nr:thiamine diphosphokinase [Synergistales bacterium]
MKFLKKTSANRKNILTLPQMDILYPYEIPSEKILLVAGGNKPDKDWIYKLSGSYSIWAVDKGLDLLKELDIKPDLLIGDLDSADPGSILWAEELDLKKEIFHPDKDLTDLQLSILMALELENPYVILITGCWGERFDHTLSTCLSALRGYMNGLHPLCLSDARESMLFLCSSDTVCFYPKQKVENISLFALSVKCTGISISGTKWELSNASLSLYEPFAISNKMKEGEERIKIQAGEGCLGVYFQWK